jgi:hypothetical protein
VSSSGETLWKETRDSLGCWGSVLEPLHNWDGSYADQLLAWNLGCGVVAGIWDGFGNRIATFPVDGRMVRGDVCGDDRSEVVDYVMGDRAYVYASAACDLGAKVTGHPLPQAKKHYNYTRYTAEEIPLELSRGHNARASSALPRHDAGNAVDGNPDTKWISSPFDIRPSWSVDLGRLRELTGIAVDFGSQPANLSYRVESSLDGLNWVELVTRQSSQELQRSEFTGLGRYLRIVATRHAGPVQLADVQVFGSR